ncbi:MAG: hypothetical protein Q9187_007643 [Circinaria calcarea]
MTRRAKYFEELCTGNCHFPIRQSSSRPNRNNPTKLERNLPAVLYPPKLPGPDPPSRWYLHPSISKQVSLWRSCQILFNLHGKNANRRSRSPPVPMTSTSRRIRAAMAAMPDVSLSDAVSVIPAIPMSAEYHVTVWNDKHEAIRMENKITKA